eukprot:14452586-Heterocapsa_arctica.AAC.1
MSPSLGPFEDSASEDSVASGSHGVPTSTRSPRSSRSRKLCGSSAGYPIYSTSGTSSSASTPGK